LLKAYGWQRTSISMVSSDCLGFQFSLVNIDPIFMFFNDDLLVSVSAMQGNQSGFLTKFINDIKYAEQ